MNKIKFPIGDWSHDGHGKCEYFLATTPLTVVEVREAHFAAPTVLGFDIGSICNEYGEYEINPEVIKKISTILPAWADSKIRDPEFLFFLWIDLLNHIDPRLMLAPVVEDIQEINFYGFDDKGRHLCTPGYGLFE